MEYKKLGNTGLIVSRIGYGNWINTEIKNAQENANSGVKKAWELGINFFDTAELYGDGEGEKQFGIALKELNVPRSELIITTKLYWSKRDKDYEMIKQKNFTGLCRKKVLESMKVSLRSLQLEYVDIVFAHRYDPDTPLEEVCRAFDQIIRDGQAFYWATSEWQASQIFHAFMICEKYNLIKPIADQCEYNMLNRQKMEVDYQELFDQYNYGTTIWSPLCGGMLTGKYNKGIPESCRLKMSGQVIEHFYKKKFFTEEGDIKENWKKLFNGLEEMAKRLECTQAQLAMAWVLKYSNVSVAITGASSPSQLEDTVKAVQIEKKMTKEICEEIESFLETRPTPWINARSFKPMPHRR